MRIAPSTRQSTRAQLPTARGELVLRYGAAFACTLVSIAAAQLIVSNGFALSMAALTILGLPVSLFWRFSKLRVFGRRVPRFLINSIVVMSSGAACVYLVFLTQGDWFARGFYQAYILRGMAESFTVAVQMVLIFAAFRSFAIINDKDAVLCAISSFSVLLFLIVIHRGPAVVVYFLAWAVFSAILFALDHRAELRHNLNGVVPSLVPHQDVKLSARGLATVMSFALACAVGISWYLSSRNPDERGVLESWILGMAGRMTQVALNIPDVSVNSGPERQIDYSSGPALPTRAELWMVGVRTREGGEYRPRYWRMFTLSQYNGATWSQTPGSGFGVKKQILTAREWMPRLGQPGSGSGSGSTPGFRFSIPPRGDGSRRIGVRRNGSQRDGNMRRNSNRSASTPAASPPKNGGGQPAGQPTETTETQELADFLRRWRRPGYDILHQHPQGRRMAQSFGAPRRLFYQVIESRVANVGYIPTLPSVRGLRLPEVELNKLPDTLRVRQDGAVDTGVLGVGQHVILLSEVAPDPAYGATDRKHAPPLTTSQNGLNNSFNSGAKLSAYERRLNLQLPPRLSKPDSRVLKFARQVLRSARPNETNLRRAQRLAWAIQVGAVYTLRPPQIPAGADAAEFFLFQSRRGYCTYFAGALTVLCREAGIPARVASGFANPEWDARSQMGMLREANAHAWTEVWVEGWGWAVVDATPAGARGDNSPDWWENWSDLFGASIDAAKRWSATHSPLLWFSTLLFLCGVLALATQRGLADPLFARLQNWTQGRVKLSEDQSRRLIFGAYERMAKKLARKFRPRISWETPHEYLAAAERALDLESAASLRELTRLYARAKYSPRDIDNRDGQTAYQALKNLSWKTRKA